MDPDFLAQRAADIARERARPLEHDVQRPMAFYRVTVSFRNAVEQMRARHGRLDDPDHRWWGFGDLRQSRGDPGPSPDWSDGDGLAGTRVPKHPPPAAGGASVELEEPNEGAVA